MTPGAILAQEAGESAVRVDFRIIDSDELPAPPVGWRLYGEPRQLQFRAGVANYPSKAPVLIDTEGIQTTVGLIIERETEIPITLRWIDGQITVNEEPTALASGSSWVRLEPRETLGWTIVAERADGRPFESGQYYVTSGFAGVRSVVRNIDGTNWQGKVSEGIGQWSLLVRPPTSAAERVRMYEIGAEAAKRRGDTARALSEYAQLLEVDPANANAQISMGSIHFFAGRYGDAITWYERAAQKVRDSHHATRLAMAYVGAGQDHKAVDVLRAAGFSDERVATELEQARRAAADGSPVERKVRNPLVAAVARTGDAVAISADGPQPDPQQLLLRLREVAERESARRKTAERVPSAR